MRIWIARAEPAASRTAERLERLGHTPLVAPVTRIARTTEPAPREPFDAVLLTSANGVSALAGTALADAPVFTVGEKTAAAARAAGIASVAAAEGDAASLAALVTRTLAPGAALLHLAGEDRKPEPSRTLERAGFRLSVWIAYAAVPVDRLPEPVRVALSTGGSAPLGAALHYSRRSAAIALQLARDSDLAEPFARVAHYCLSVDVAVPLVESGIAAHFVPARPDEEGLLAGLPDAG